MKLHPDVNLNRHAGEEQLKQINEAYHVLCDDSKRAEYDQILARREASQIQNQTSKKTTNNQAQKNTNHGKNYQQFVVKNPSTKRKYRKFIIWTIIISLIAWGYRSCKKANEKEYADNLRWEQYRKEDSIAAQQEWTLKEGSLGKIFLNYFKK